jgi:superfamily II DNA/RNA helicase
VYATPEVLLRSRSHFLKNTVRKDNVFKKNLCLIAMDEAHTIWGYRKFRRQFKHVGNLRSLFPQVPFAALSATFPPHIVEYVRRVCNMKSPTNIITVNGRRNNIHLLVAEQHGKDNIDQLLELIPDSDDFSIHDLPQTLIFVDAVEMAVKIARALRAKLSKIKSGGCKPWTLVRTYYASIDKEQKLRTERLVANGNARFVVCTDSLSLGVDFSGIDRVIQWGVTEKLTMDVLVQRLGRAARGEGVQGLGIVFTPFDLVKPIGKNWETAWERVAAESREDHSDVSSPTGASSNVISPDLLSLPVLPETESKVSELKSRLYRKADAEHECSQDGNAPKSASGRKRSSRKGIDPGVLWFLGTVGCRHRCLVSYMDYPNVCDDEGQQSWCCDNCAINRNLPRTEIKTAGFSPASSITLQSGSQKPKAIRVREVRGPLRPPLPGIWADKVKENIETWRNLLRAKLVARRCISAKIPVDAVLPNAVVNAIAGAIRKIVSVESLRGVFRSAHYYVDRGLLRPKDVDELFYVVDTTLKGATPLSQGSPSALALLTCVVPAERPAPRAPTAPRVPTAPRAPIAPRSVPFLPISTQITSALPRDINPTPTLASAPHELTASDSPAPPQEKITTIPTAPIPVALPGTPLPTPVGDPVLTDRRQGGNKRKLASSNAGNSEPKRQARRPLIECQRTMNVGRTQENKRVIKPSKKLRDQQA